MVKHPDEAFKKLNDLTHNVFPKISESDTRAKYIDPLFTQCLGWTEEDIVRETHVSGGFIDYVFSIDGIRKFVLEAKTLGHSFRVPDSQTSRRFKIGGSIASDAKIRQALEQAQRYCVKVGVKYGIITNGTQYIAFEAFVPGSDWTDGYCVVFKSFDEIKENFSLFWNTFSRQSVHDQSLRKYVSEEELPLEFVIPRKRLHAQDSALVRNNLSPILAPFIYHVFGTLTEDSQIDALRDCYVSKREFQDADAQIGRHLVKPPHFAEKYFPTVVLESEREAGAFQREYELDAEFLRSTPDNGTMFMLMGGIGAGKTTFIHHFFKFIIAPKNKEALWFYVDFLKGPPNPDLIESFVYESVLDDATRKYPDITKQIQSDLAKQGIGPLRPDLKDLVVLFSRLVLRGTHLPWF